ncbi:hypothetical protein AVEN_53692-1 [Araneus ventricosus]|uniref:Uncharacterized protein n=1 Tax=Araneus ventricosus TaxID=182803 RepID=A0A4Y2RKJ0_ARAVE|nr:hypothetical protein AVEN_53692-1 [Araneus ventricosus]
MCRLKGSQCLCDEKRSETKNLGTFRCNLLLKMCRVQSNVAPIMQIKCNSSVKCTRFQRVWNMLLLYCSSQSGYPSTIEPLSDESERFHTAGEPYPSDHFATHQRFNVPVRHGRKP